MAGGRVERAWRAGGRAALAGSRGRIRGPSRSLYPRLLDKDGGKLASLVDAVHALDSRHQAFVLGSWIPSPDARADRFRTLYGADSRLLAVWDPAARPFVRLLYDGAHALAVTAVDPTGQATGPTSVRLWRKVFDGVDIPSDPAGDSCNPATSDGHVDAAWLLEVLADVGQSFAVRRNRAEVWLFAQRVFSDAPRISLPDVFVTLRGFSRFRVLLCSLERMGVVDPKVYAAAVTQADRLSRIDDRERAAVAQALFQGSVALVERARTARTIDAASAESLLRSLCALPVSENGEVPRQRWRMDDSGADAGVRSAAAGARRRRRADRRRTPCSGPWRAARSRWPTHRTWGSGSKAFPTASMWPAPSWPG